MSAHTGIIPTGVNDKAQSELRISNDRGRRKEIGENVRTWISGVKVIYSWSSKRYGILPKI